MKDFVYSEGNAALWLPDKEGNALIVVDSSNNLAYVSFNKLAEWVDAVREQTPDAKKHKGDIK